MKRFAMLITGLLIPVVAHAYSITSTGWNCDGFLECGSGTDVVVDVTTNIVNTVAKFIGALAVVVFFYGAIRMIVSQGQEGKEAGKKALEYAAFGMVAALLVSAIVEYIRDYLYYLGT